MSAFSYNQAGFNRAGNYNNQDNDQVALFIDWDNLVISNYQDTRSNRPDLTVLVRRAQEYGTVVIARAYAEWNLTADRLEVYKAGIEPIYAPVFHADKDLSGQTGRGKSLADPVMVTDCIDFLHLLPQIGTYILVTGDKDMVPVVRLVRLRGKRVVIIGPDYVANVLQQVSDEFIPYRLLLSQSIPVDPYTGYIQQQPGVAFQPGVAQPQGYFANPATANQAGNSRGRGKNVVTRRGAAGYQNPAQPYGRVVVPPPQAATYGYFGQVPTGQPGFTPEGYPIPPTGQPALNAPVGYPAAPGMTNFAVAPGTLPTPTNFAVAPGTPNFAVAPGTPGMPNFAVAPGTPGLPNFAVAPGTPGTPNFAVAPGSVTPELDPSFAKPATNALDQVKETIREIVIQRASTGRIQMRSRDLKEELLRRLPGFHERNFGFSKFKQLLNAVEAENFISVDPSGNFVNFRINQPANSLPPFVPSQPQVDNLLSDASQIDSDNDDEMATEAEVASTVTLPKPATAESSERPAILNQPHFEDAILLVDRLRPRYRWLGYDLLLTNIRDLLIRTMPESEAKMRAGNILSELLNSGILEMKVEVHSRGARKMTTKVAYLRDDNPAVRYVLANALTETQSSMEPGEGVGALGVDLLDGDEAGFDTALESTELFVSHYTRQYHPPAASAIEQNGHLPEEFDSPQAAQQIYAPLEEGLESLSSENYSPESYSPENSFPEMGRIEEEAEAFTSASEFSEPAEPVSLEMQPADAEQYNQPIAGYSQDEVPALAYQPAEGQMGDNVNDSSSDEMPPNDNYQAESTQPENYGQENQQSYHQGEQPPESNEGNSNLMTYSEVAETMPEMLETAHSTESDATVADNYNPETVEVSDTSEGGSNNEPPSTDYEQSNSVEQEATPGFTAESETDEVEEEPEEVEEPEEAEATPKVVTRRRTTRKKVVTTVPPAEGEAE